MKGELDVMSHSFYEIQLIRSKYLPKYTIVYYVLVVLILIISFNDLFNMIIIFVMPLCVKNIKYMYVFHGMGSSPAYVS